MFFILTAESCSFLLKHPTPHRTDSQSGQYKYHVTADPPFVLGCFKAEVNNKFCQELDKFRGFKKF